MAGEIEHPVRRFVGLRAALLGLVLLLGTMSISVPFLARTTRLAIERTTSHDIAWNAANGREEFHELQDMIWRSAVGADVSPDQIRIAYAIMRSRIDTWRSGAFGDFLREEPERLAHFRQIKHSVDLIGPMLPGGAGPVDNLTAARLLDAATTSVTKLSAAAYTFNARGVASNNALLRNLQLAQQVLIGALLFCGFLLLGLFGLQNRMLDRAHREQRAIAQDNAYLAAHDVLTGLSNRAEFARSLAARRMAGECFAVAILDLDGFKPVNDVLGHRTGDALLVSIAGRLRDFAALVPGASAARFGGDEFTFLLPGIADGEEAAALVHKLIAGLCLPHRLDGHEVLVGCSAGIALAGSEEEDDEDIIARADLALAVAKAEGRGRATLFLPEMLESARARAEIEADLMGADIWSEFEPSFQPIIDLASGEIAGCEALARWRHPQRGMVSPAQFIPVAEHCGRIAEIGEVMLRKACRAAAAFPSPITVSVNVSAAQLLRARVQETVMSALKESGLPPQRLKLEITESVMIGDQTGIRLFMDGMQKLGVAVSLDDFGTGYSSLSYLRDLPFDELKIDRAFISSLSGDRQAQAVVRTIIALARDLDMRVVAEGIETQEQALFLRALGCARAQGYYFGKPMTAAALCTMLAAPAVLQPLQLSA